MISFAEGNHIKATMGNYFAVKGKLVIINQVAAGTD
jgi:hypothetical protein